MAETISRAAVIRHHCCRVGPPAESAEEQYLPLTFLDMVWLHFHSIQRLFFYQFPCSKSHFFETILPHLKDSLSQTLKHYLPLTGNLLYPVESGALPVFRCVSGDSVSVTVAESREATDLKHLTGDGMKEADEFYSFVPELPGLEIKPESGFRIIPLLAIQITLFADAGICIGFNNHHVIGDASSIVGFIKSWSSTSRLNGDENRSLPFNDRAVIKDPSGLAETFWNEMKVQKLVSLPVNFPTNKLRATFTLHKKDIQYLREAALAKNPSLTHLSSFTLTTAYVWTCLVKSAAETGEQVHLNEPEYFGFAADARARLDPPVPANYFGNCVAIFMTESTEEQLRGADGFSIAVELIGKLVTDKVNNKDEILKDAESWPAIFGALVGKRLFGVAGSPRFDVYDSDFGWGRPRKYEAVSIDGDGSMSLCKSRDLESSLEIGLSLPKAKMDAFASIFQHGLIE